MNASADKVSDDSMGLRDDSCSRNGAESVHLGERSCIASVGLDARVSDGAQREGVRERDVKAPFHEVIDKPVPVERTLDDHVCSAIESS